MRVAITFPHSLATPGGGTHDCLELAKSMARAGAEVSMFPVVTWWPSSYPRMKVSEAYRGNEQAAELAQEGIEVFPVEQNTFHYLLDGRRMPRAIEKLHQERGLDAVLGWQNETFFLPRLARRHGIVLAMNAAASYRRLFYDSRVSPLRRLRRMRSQLFFGKPFRDADVVFARSEFTRGEIMEYIGVREDRIRIAYLGIDTSLADVPRERADKLTRFFFFGNWVEEKGLADTMIALGRVASGGRRDWTLRLAGWGDEEYLQGLAQEAGISDRIEVVGHLERPKLLESLEWAQLAILPSHTESFGLANAESQTAGLPVIAYRVAAVPEVVQDGKTGWLVPFLDHDALTRVLEEALDDPQEAFDRGLAGRERMLGEFTWEHTARATLAGLEAALDAKKHAKN